MSWVSWLASPSTPAARGGVLCSREAPPSIPPPRKACTSLLDKHMVSVNKSAEGTLGVALHGLMDAHAAAKVCWAGGLCGVM